MRLLTRSGCALGPSGEQWQARTRTQPPATELTETERVIARLLRDGLSNTEIGARLGLTRPAVKQRLFTIYSKLGFEGREARVLLAVWMERQERSEP